MEQRCPLGASGSDAVPRKSIIIKHENEAAEAASPLSPSFCRVKLSDNDRSASAPAPSVLFVTYGWSETGGGTVYPRLVALELARRGYDVAVFYASLDNDPACSPYLLTECFDQNVHLFGLSNRPALFTDPDHPEREICDPQVVERFCQVLDRISPDLVHFHNFHGLTFAIAEETHKRKIPSCFTPHNYHLIDPDLYLLKSGLEQWNGIDPFANSEAVARNPEKRAAYLQRVETARRLVNEWVTVMLAVSQRQKELLSSYGVDSSRMVVLHQASPVADQLWNDPVLSAAVHRPVQLPLRIGFIGGVLPIKGVHMLVAAAQAFRNDQLKIHIHGFVQKDYLEQLIALDRNGMVIFHGGYSPGDLLGIAVNLDLAVLPSVVEESAPTLVLSELHAMRLPVIAARIGGIPEFITDEVDGLLYRHDDLEGLVAVLRKCVERPELIRKMRSNLVDTTHTFGRYMARLEKLYRLLLRDEVINAEACSLLASRRGQSGSESPGLPFVSWQGGLFVHHSLSLVNRELCLQLVGRGFDISFTSTQPDDFSVAEDDRLKSLEGCRNKHLPAIDVTVRHQWPPDFSPAAAGKLVAIQPWEFGSAPVEWVQQINQHVDELWVPSSFVRECYLQSGVQEGKVQLVPNGVATECFNPAASSCSLSTSKKFRFLFVGGTIQRKGIDLLLAAYAAKFSAADDVCLVIKDMGGGGIYQGQTAEDMIAAFRSVANHPEIVYIEDMYDDCRMAALYNACHCLVHPYRGEGFGLPIAEAMACGLAPIVTGYGAALDFCPPEIAWLIPAEKHLLPEKKIGNLTTVDFPWLAEPDLAALAALMRHAFEHPDEVKQRGSAASRHIREHFTWDHAAQVAEKRLRLLAQKVEKGVVNSKQSGNRMPQQEPVDIEAKESEVAMQNQLVQAACFKAEKLAQRGDVDAAVQVMLNEGIGGDADSPIPYLVLSGILMAAGRFEEVLGVAAEMPPATEKYLIHEIEAQCFCALGDDAAARKAAMLAGEQSPLALVVLGTLSARQGNTANGEQLFRQAIVLDSSCGKAWLSLAMILWSQGKLPDAWEAVKQAVSIDPLNAEAVKIMRDMASRMV